MAIIIFQFVVLLFSAVLHEVAHGYEAERLGDPTARNAGRLTLNPLVHLDPIFSVALPLLLYFASGGSFFFAAAKPVPFDPRYLKDPRSGSAKIASAGPLTNLLLAAIFGLAIRVLVNTSVPVAVLGLFAVIVQINIILGVFNLIPIPPLDGSRLLFALLPPSRATYRIMYFLERWGMILVFAFVVFGFGIIRPVMNLLFTLFTGQ